MKLSLLKVAVLTTAASLGCAGIAAQPAQALSVTQQQLDVMTQDADTLTWTFSGLPLSDGSGGLLRLFTGVSQNFPGVFDGLDLGGDTNEFFTLFVEGTNVGQFTCTGSPGTPLPGNTGGGNDCDFDVSFNFLTDFGLNLAPLVADGSLTVEAVFGPEVSHFDERDELFAELSYTAVPTPALLPGLMGLGLGVWRKRKGTVAGTEA